jgi:hypothetical protein
MEEKMKNLALFISLSPSDAGQKERKLSAQKKASSLETEEESNYC